MSSEYVLNYNKYIRLNYSWLTWSPTSLSTSAFDYTYAQDVLRTFTIPKNYNFNIYFWRWFFWTLLWVKDTDFFKVVWLMFHSPLIAFFNSANKDIRSYFLLGRHKRLTVYLCKRWVPNILNYKQKYGLIILDGHFSEHRPAGFKTVCEQNIPSEVSISVKMLFCFQFSKSTLVANLHFICFYWNSTLKACWIDLVCRLSMPSCSGCWVTSIVG